MPVGAYCELLGACAVTGALERSQEVSVLPVNRIFFNNNISSNVLSDFFLILFLIANNCKQLLLQIFRLSKIQL